MPRTFFILFFAFLVLQQTTAQAKLNLGLMPKINLQKALNNGYKINTKLESRLDVLETEWFGQNTNTNVSYVLTDVSALLAKKLTGNQTIAGGYLIRFRDQRVFHRLIQQYSKVQQFPSFRLAHRLVADQTFQSNESPDFRFRYRIGIELPLQGHQLNSKEFYLKLHNEYLNQIQSNQYDLEIRLIPNIGYLFNPKNKLEVGLDSRFQSFIHESHTNTNMWLSFNWYIIL